MGVLGTDGGGATVNGPTPVSDLIVWYDDFTHDYFRAPSRYWLEYGEEGFPPQHSMPPSASFVISDDFANVPWAVDGYYHGGWTGDEGVSTAPTPAIPHKPVLGVWDARGESDASWYDTEQEIPPDFSSVTVELTLVSIVSWYKGYSPTDSEGPWQGVDLFAAVGVTSDGDYSIGQNGVMCQIIGGPAPFGPWQLAIAADTDHTDRLVQAWYAPPIFTLRDLVMPCKVAMTLFSNGDIVFELKDSEGTQRFTFDNATGTFDPPADTSPFFGHPHSPEKITPDQLNYMLAGGIQPTAAVGRAICSDWGYTISRAKPPSTIAAGDTIAGEVALMDAELMSFEALRAEQALQKRITGSGYTGSPPPTVQGNYSLTDLVHLARSVGFSHDEAAIAGAIAMAESGGDPRNTGYNAGPPSSVDRGLWQINSLYNSDTTDACAFNPVCCAQAALRYFRTRGWSDWTTYTNGAYLQYLADAQAVP